MSNPSVCCVYETIGNCLNNCICQCCCGEKGGSSEFCIALVMAGSFITGTFPICCLIGGCLACAHHCKPKPPTCSVITIQPKSV